MSVFGISVHRKAILRDVVQRGRRPGLAIARALLHPKNILVARREEWATCRESVVLVQDTTFAHTHYFAQTSPVDQRIRLQEWQGVDAFRAPSRHRGALPGVLRAGYPTDPGVWSWTSEGISTVCGYAAFSGARKVFAFEANREAYGRMLENISRNSLQTVIAPHNYAVTSKSGEVVAIPKGASPQNRITYGPASSDGYESVQTISLDESSSGKAFLVSIS